MKTWRAAFALAAVALAAACADIPGITPTPPALPPPPPAPPMLVEPEEGSLWQGESSRRFLAFENRAGRVGDLLTVQIAEEATAANEASTALERTSDFDAKINSELSLQTVIARPVLAVLSLLGFSDQRTDKNPTTELTIADAESTTKYEGDGIVTREASFTTTVACLVTHVTESGLLRIEGERHLKINNETQIIRLTGYVRPEDVRIDNTVQSTMIASADIEYGGIGLVSEKQRAPWMMRLMELVIPF